MDVRGGVDLRVHGIAPTGRVVSSPSTPVLYEHAIARGEARLAEGGPMVVDTGRHTGRSPKDKFVVREPGSESRIWWDGNQEIGEDVVRAAPREGHGAPRPRDDAVRRRRVRGRRPRPPRRRPRRDDASVPRALREDDVHRADDRRAALVRAAGARAARARSRRAAEVGRDAHGHLHRAAPVADGGPRRRHVLRGRDQEVDLHRHERPAAARGRAADALLGERRRGRPARRSSSVCPARARRRSPPIPSAPSSATTSTAGATRASSTSRAAATRR